MGQQDIFNLDNYHQILQKTHTRGFDNFCNQYTNNILCERIGDALKPYNYGVVHSNGGHLTHHANIKNLDYYAPVPIPHCGVWPVGAPCPNIVKKYDIIISQMVIHRMNDIMAGLKHYRAVANNGALLLGVVPGRGSMEALKHSIYAIEHNQNGNVALRFLPLPSAEQMTAMLQASGLDMIIVDTIQCPIEYHSYTNLLRDKRALGEPMAMANPTRTPLPRAVAQFLRQTPIKIDMEWVFFHGVFK